MKTKAKGILIMAAFVTAVSAFRLEAMGKNPASNTSQDTSGQTGNPGSPTPSAAAPPANRFYDPANNTGPAAPGNENSMPMDKGGATLPAVPPVTPTPIPPPEPGSSAATGVGPYGGAPSGPQGGR